MGGALQRRGVSKDDLAALLEISRACDTLYLHLTGLAREDDAEIVAVLEDVYECVARVDPSAEVVPLLERCGWDADAVMALEDRIGDEDHVVTLSLELEEGGGVEEGDETTGDDTSVDKTSVGGTFDRMHAGHRLLLATASAGATILDLSFGRSIRVSHRGERVDSEQHFLGAAIGHRAKIGNGVRLNYGVEVPNDAFLVPPSDDLIRDTSAVEPGVPCRAEEGKALPVKRSATKR